MSVIIPVYRRQDQATEALRSVLLQTGVLFEVVIVDDGSPDPYRLPADCLADARVRLIRSARNAGAAAARNRGVFEAKAPWLAFLDSDDLWVPGKLQRQLAFAQAGSKEKDWPPLTAVVTGFRKTELSSGKAVSRVPRASNDPADFAAGCWFAPGSTALVPRAAFHEVGPIDETLERLEDLDWFLRLALAGGGIRVLKSIEVDVRIGGRPSRERFDRAAQRLSRKWLDRGASGRLPVGPRRNLSAYLAVEKASTRYFAGDIVGGLLAMAWSWVLRPRFRLHLQNWWPRS